MEEIGVYTTVAISILGVGFPILLQVISTLDEKYASIQIVELFDSEWSKKLFKYALVSSLIAVCIWSMKLEPIISIKGLEYVINNSAALLLVLSSVILVGAFLFLVDRIITYLTPIKFVHYLINKHRRDINELKYFKALSDVFLHAIQKRNYSLSEPISRFMYEDFKMRRELAGSAPVVYPDAHYTLVYKATEELASQKEKKNKALEYRIGGGIWLLGEMGEYEISEKTYSVLWLNLLTIVEFDRDDMVMDYWSRAHQHMTFALKLIIPKFSEDRQVIENSTAIEKRKNDRQRFLEFNYALGGLLLYKKRYSCIRRMFVYTTSEPPWYELLPDTMDEIVTCYVRHRGPHGILSISHVYRFPDMEGVRADVLIIKWISAYCALLFLRLYGHRLNYSSTPLPAYPRSPKLQSEKRLWISGMDFFEKLTTEHLQNHKLLEAIKFQFITRDWCTSVSKPYPTDFIKTLKSQLEKDYELGAIHLDISTEKEKLFLSKSQEILEERLNGYTDIQNVKHAGEDSNKYYIHGRRMTQSKDAFAETSEVHYIDFDTFLAREVSKDVHEGIGSTFLASRKTSYLLKPTDLFFAIERIANAIDHVIISFGMDIERYISYWKVSGLSESDFKGIKLFNYAASYSLSQSIFVVKKTELPKITTINIEEGIIAKYSGKRISTTHELFASVIDLNTAHEDIIRENKGQTSLEELKKSVLLTLIFTVEISWPKNIDMIQMMEYSEYRQDGKPNSLSDISNTSKN